ncbi:hypothetical protein BVRB_2g024850 isoform A [Beta vulgaris subsp. vulgaris]|nr:hypothetical protein BVRB_2g024850 isoform A [Beta vulgaris subsp. vulgaris]
MQFKVFLGAPVIGSFSADFRLSFTSIASQFLLFYSENDEINSALTRWNLTHLWAPQKSKFACLKQSRKTTFHLLNIFACYDFV